MMRRVPRLAIAAACVSIAILAPAGPRPARAPADRTFDTIADLVAVKMREYHVPGVALGVLRDGKTAIRGFGVTSVEDPLPVTDGTIFPLARISKTVTALAVMRLVEQGKLDLRAPVRKYLTDFRVQDQA